MKKLFTLLLFLSVACLGVKAQTTIVIKGDIDHHVANQKVWINYLGKPSTCDIKDSTLTDTLGHFMHSITIGAGCSFGDIAVSMMGCKFSLLKTLHYDSTTTNPDTMSVSFKYCDTCNIHAGFTASVSGFNANFANTSTVLGFTSFIWYFGDGGTYSTTSATATTSHTYSPGTYTVSFVAYDPKTYCKDSITKTIIIGANCSGFAADYNYVLTGTTVALTNTSSSSATNFLWTFGDGNKSTSNSLSYSYKSAGNYTICLVARDTTNGCLDTICKTITVADCSIFLANFSFISTNLSTTFANTTSSTASTYHWNFGDGNTSTALSPTHVYGSSGNYTACLLAKDTVHGCIDSICKTVSVVDCNALIASFNDSVMTDTVVFTNTSNTLPGSTNAYFWIFGDGDVSGLANPTHIYSTAGVHTACLFVTSSNGGCSDSACKSITVTSPCGSYSANFTFSTSALTANFTNGSSAGTNYSYWDFGDGYISTANNPSHTYSVSGIYLVCLKSYNTIAGCSDSICKYVTVTAGCLGFTANFVYKDSCQSMQFANVSSFGSNSFSWTFGDASTSNVEHPSHTYASSGMYTVCLIARDTVNGCSDTVCKVITLGNSLTGSIYRDSSNLADSGIVYLIQVTIDTVAHDTILTAIDSAYFSSATGGKYHFNTVPTGTYLLKAALLPGSAFYANRIPTYYVQETQWRDASYVNINTACANTDIELITGTNPGGSGFIGGYVSVGANKTGDPLERIEVLLYNADNTPFGYTYTDANGEYKFDNIAFGTYKVVVDVVGKPCQEYFVTINNATPNDHNGNFEVNTKNITLKSGATAIGSISKQNLMLYPNPAANTVNVSFNAYNQGIATIIISDLTGKQVMVTEQTIETGNNTIALDVNQLNYGVYLITVNADNRTVIGKLSINR